VAKSAPDMLWLPIAGLDRHTPLIGLRPLSDPDTSVALNGGPALQAIYRPISPFYTAGRTAA
jgi:hypothetical protein